VQAKKIADISRSGEAGKVGKKHVEAADTASYIYNKKLTRDLYKRLTG